MFRKLMKSDALRKRTSWMLALVLIPPFIFFFHMFVSAPRGNGPGGTAGTLFGKPVPWDLYQEQYDWARRQWLNQLNQESDHPVTELPEGLDTMITQVAWDRLMLIAEAQRMHRRVSDLELADVIGRDPAFQVNGRFVPERYQWYLRAAGMTPRMFEDALRHQMLIRQLVEDLKEGVTVTDDDARAAFIAEHEQLRAAAVFIDPAAFRDAVRGALTDAALRADYGARPDALRTRERITFDYVGLTRDELANTLTVPDEEIATYYEAHADEFKTETGERRPLDAVKDAIRATLLPRQIRRRLNELAIQLEDARDASQRFEEIAATTSLSVHQVGPLEAGNPWVKDAPEPALLEAAFTLAEGGMSQVVETDTGVYLARLTQREASRLPPFEEVRAQVLERLLNERAREAAKAAATEQRAKLAEQLKAGAAVEAAAQSLGLPLRHPAPFTRSDAIESLGNVSVVNTAAFATPLGSVSDVVEIPQGFVLVAPQERIAPDESKLADQRQSLRERLLTEKQNQHYGEWMDGLRHRAKLHSNIASHDALGRLIQRAGQSGPAQPAR